MTAFLFATLTILGIFIPEAALAMLYVGMAAWALLPDFGEGYRLPLTFVWVIGCYLLHGTTSNRRKRGIVSVPVERKLALFTLVAAISLLWSANRPYGQWKLLLFGGMAAGMTWFLGLWYQHRLGMIKKLPIAFGIASLAPLAVLVDVSWRLRGFAGLLPWNIFVERRLQFEEVYSVFGASDALLTAGLCCVYQASISKKAARLLWALLILSDVWGLLLLGQRAQFVIFVLAVPLIGLGWRRGGTKAPSAAVLLGRMVVVLSLCGILVNVQLSYNVRSSYEFMADDSSLSNRVLAAQTALEAFIDNPVMGVGLGNFATYFQLRSTEFVNVATDGAFGSKLNSKVRRVFPHNIFLEVLAEMGIIGFALWASFCSAVVRLCRSALRQSRVFDLHALAWLSIAWIVARLLVCATSGDLAMLNFGPPLAVLIAIHKRATLDRQDRIPVLYLHPRGARRAGIA